MYHNWCIAAVAPLSSTPLSSAPLDLFWMSRSGARPRLPARAISSGPHLDNPDFLLRYVSCDSRWLVSIGRRFFQVNRLLQWPLLVLIPQAPPHCHCWPHIYPPRTYVRTLRLFLSSALPPRPDVQAHTNRTVLPYPASPVRFHTFPDSRLSTGSHFRFVVTSCLKPNFPYVPFQNKRIKGFDLLADYLFAEPTVVDTPGTVAYVKANENVTEGPIPLENEVRGVVPASLEVDVAPTEFMLFLVRGSTFLLSSSQRHSDIS